MSERDDFFGEEPVRPPRTEQLRIVGAEQAGRRRGALWR